MEPKTPELEKIASVRDESQKLGEFIDWLRNEKGLEIATWIPDVYSGDRLVPANVNTEKLLADYFKIDLDKAEEERQAVLSHIRG